jgi:hypothetical protein
MVPAFAAVDPVSNLDDLAHSVHGRLLLESSPGYDEARRVWNLACDRRRLAMVPRGERRRRATLRGVRWQARGTASLGAPRLRELPAAKHTGANS